MLPNKAANRYTTSRQLISGEDVNNITDQLNSSAVGLVATPGGTKAAALQLNAASNVIATCATNGDSVMLPVGTIAGLEVWIQNAGAADVQVFGKDSDTIDGVATAIGVTQGETTLTLYKCMTPRVGSTPANWVSK